MPVLVKAGRFGPYVQLGEADDVEGKPRTASLLQGTDPSSITMKEALRLLTLPRTVGQNPDSGEEIVATNGRYGPYLRKANDSRSSESEEQLFTVTLDQALALFAQPTDPGSVTGAGTGSGQRGDYHVQGWSIRSVCDRRDDECLRA